MDELSCKYVGSYALMKSCSKRNPVSTSDTNLLNPVWYSNLKDGDILHVCPQAIPKFVSEVLPEIKTKFILVTNASIMTIPTDVKESLTILMHPLLIRWFAQNCTSDYSKLVRIPLGLDYHSLRPEPKSFVWSTPNNSHKWGDKKNPVDQERDLINIQKSAPSTRICKGYGNFQFLMTTRFGKNDRTEAFETLPKEIMFYEPKQTTRNNCWKNMVKYAFVVSPQGNGLDCHRTWEALCLGCYPIIKTSGLDPLFDDLPVWIINEWSDVTAETMKEKMADFGGRTFKLEKLTLKYWQDLIRCGN